MPDWTTAPETPDVHGAPAPFIIRRERTPERGSHFTPTATLVLTPALRTSGLWRALPPERLKDLLLLLTFLTPDGRIRPTAPELTDAIGVSEVKARVRLERLSDFTWHGKPLVRRISRESGLDAYAPADTLLAVQESPAGSPPDFGRRPDPAPRPAGRDAVLEYSRARYARPREEVERGIAGRMGWAPPAFSEDEPGVAVRKQNAYETMTNLGVPKEQALDLLARFDITAVEQQLEWLQYRNAKSPARLLAAAVEHSYAPPAALRPASETVAPREETPPAEDVSSDEHEPPQEHALEDLAWDLSGHEPVGEEVPW